MNAIDIVNQIKEERKNRVIIQWDKKKILSTKPKAVTSECWAVTVTDEPELYFDEQNKKFQSKVTHCSKFEISSFSEGVELYSELIRHFKSEESLLPEQEKCDSSKQLYLAIHIHYHLA